MTVGMALVLIAFLAAYSGGAMIALGNPVHWGAVMHVPLPSPNIGRRQKQFGGALTALSIIFVIMRDGWSFGLLLGPLIVGLGLACVIVTLTLRPRLLRMFAFN